MQNLQLKMLKSLYTNVILSITLLNSMTYVNRTKLNVILYNIQSVRLTMLKSLYKGVILGLTKLNSMD